MRRATSGRTRRFYFQATVVGVGFALSACGGGSDGTPTGSAESSGTGGPGGAAGNQVEPPDELHDRADWFADQTVALRGTLSIPLESAWLSAAVLAPQLEEYDPGATARCAVEDDANYAQLLDELGGVRWGYGVSVLQDASKPNFLLGIRAQENELAADANTGGGGVTIAEADIVGVSETSALFLSSQHGLLMVDLSGTNPQFKCAAKLPGVVDQFYLHNERLVVIVQDAGRRGSHLLHFSVQDDQLAFVESIDLGRSRVLDSRRFNDRLVMYTDLNLQEPTNGGSSYGNYGYYGGFAPSYFRAPNNNRMVRVFQWGDSLSEELTETHIDDTPSEQYLTREDLDRSTPVGTVIATSSRMGTDMWASDHYFVVTESQTDTRLTGFETRSYSVCVESHQKVTSYQYCSTEYEERPNPNYVEPDNNGGDRACTGTTLSSCIRKVAQVSSKTIRVPVGRSCETRERSEFVCDRSEHKSYTYPNYDYDTYTKLHIYEYTDDGFIRFSDEVSDVDVAHLTSTDLDAMVDTLALSDQTADLRINGNVQVVQFQGGYLYVVSDGVLQTYALAENSLLRTSQLEVVASQLQTAQFTEDKLYLADGSWQSSGETSVLRVIDLANPAFPSQSSTDRVLPGSHQLILPTTSGILTTGAVNRFEGQNVRMIKVGLFEDPSAEELSYLFLGTDLESLSSGQSQASFFDRADERLFWPYGGNDVELGLRKYRVGVSHIEGTEIVSEGAVDLALPPERVRPRPGTKQMLSFASSEIQTLELGAEVWEKQPVFEYFTPVSVYRRNDEDDYVEVLNLGNRCKLHFSSVDRLNERSDSSITEPFMCSGHPSAAYGQNILWNQQLAVHFEDDGSFELLSEVDAAQLWDEALNRDVCIVSEDLIPWGQAIAVDPKDTPPLDELRCFTKDEYIAYANEKRGQGY